MEQLKLTAFFFVVVITFTNGGGISEEEAKALKLVQEINAEQMIESNKASEARWNYESDMTLEHELKQKRALEKYALFNKDVAMRLKDFDIDHFHNETLKRLIRKMTDIGDSVLDAKKFTDLKDAIMNMKNIYAKTKIPCYKDERTLYSLEPEITNILESSKDPEELKYYWTRWYDLTGRPNRRDFWTYVNLRNLAAEANGEFDETNLNLIKTYCDYIGFVSGAESWLDAYEDPSFEQQCEKILSQIEPLFLQLHG